MNNENDFERVFKEASKDVDKWKPAQRSLDQQSPSFQQQCSNSGQRQKSTKGGEVSATDPFAKVNNESKGLISVSDKVTLYGCKANPDCLSDKPCTCITCNPPDSAVSPKSEVAITPPEPLFCDDCDTELQRESCSRVRPCSKCSKSKVGGVLISPLSQYQQE